MILNLSSGNSSVSAEAVKYGDYSVAETLDGLKFSTNFLNDYVSSVDDSVGNVIDGLTANGQRIYMDYQDGKYGYNTSATRGADTFSPFSQKTFDYFKVKFPKFDKTLFIETGYRPTTIVFFIKNSDGIWYGGIHDTVRVLRMMTDDNSLYRTITYVIGSIESTGFYFKNQFGGSLENGETHVYVM